MAITLVPPGPPQIHRQRIVGFGGPGAGKSNFWLSLLKNTPPEVQFHVIDTDGAWAPAARKEEYAPHVDRVHHHEPFTWDEWMANVRKIRSEMDPTRGDWCVIDLADNAWSAAQEFYQERRYEGQVDSVDFFQAVVDGSVTDDDPMDKWGVINQLYKPFKGFLVRVPGNLFCAATAKDMKKDSQGNWFRESADNVRTYGTIGARPGGQKGLAHDVDTTLYFAKTARKRTITLVKDREREDQWPEASRSGERSIDQTENPARAFLMGVAGWEVQA